GDVLLAKGSLTEARQKYEMALRIRNEIGEKPSAAENQVSLAELSVEEGHPENALAPVRDALAVFESEKLSDDEIFSVAVLAKALLALGRADDAEKELARASTLHEQEPLPQHNVQNADHCGPGARCIRQDIRGER